MDLGIAAGAVNPVGLIGTLGGALLMGGANAYSAYQQAQSVSDTNRANAALSAEQREWSANQAEISAGWNQHEAEISRQYNTAEAEKAREFSSDQALRAMNFSAGQAQVERDFQADMSNSSWQRGVADMKAAGINPMLAITQGGASSPSGAMGSSSVGATSAASASPTPTRDMPGYSRAEMKPVPSMMGAFLSGAQDLARTVLDLAKGKEELKNLAKTGGAIDAQAMKSAAEADRASQDAHSTRNQNMITDRMLNAEKNWPTVNGVIDSIVRRAPIVSSALSFAAGRYSKALQTGLGDRGRYRTLRVGDPNTSFETGGGM